MVFASGRGLETAPVGERVMFDVDPTRALFRADVHVRIIGTVDMKKSKFSCAILIYLI